ncbi:retron St85 family effector protein [Phenylobacterium glaciei]|uniref:retron St85 family effector protein n=1 Tax=Phenylobacterium glaciei TaxID=2803784 RepID=UPI0024BF6646|nr:retron St85 family effector protein [Phenylobacterium glaciei]
MDANTIRVQAPTPVVFLCGGAISDLKIKNPQSLRDAFYKIIDNPVLKGRHMIMAEDVNVYYLSRAAYRDLLSFETDLAQVCELVIIFPESEGSIAELGAFSVIEEISERLLVVPRDKKFTEKSFVKLGPLLALTNRFGARSVYVLDDDDIGMNGNSASRVNLDAVRDRLQGPIEERLSGIRNPTTFDPGKSGHKIKLITGLIQEFGGLTIGEIEGLLVAANVLETPERISGYLLCAETVGWVRPMQKGSQEFYFAEPVADAAQLSLPSDPDARDKSRRRLLIREHWKVADADRYRGIVQVSGGAR